LWHRRNRVNKTVWCPSVCLSQHGPQQQTLLPAEDIDRSIAARRTAARRYSATATLSAYVVADHRFVTSCVQNTLSNNNLAMFFHKTYDCQSKSACHSKKGKGNPYSITERRVPKLIPVLCSQPAGDVSHKAGGRLPLLSPRPELPSQPLRGQLPTSLLGEQRHDGCEQFA